MAFDSAGSYFYFDLIKDAHAPLFTGTLPHKVSSVSVDVSECHASGVTVYAAMCSRGGSEGQVSFRKLWTGLTSTHKLVDEEEQLQESMVSWAARSYVTDYSLAPPTDALLAQESPSRGRQYYEQ